MPVVTYVLDTDDIALRVPEIITVKETADLTEAIISSEMVIRGKAQPAGYTQAEMEILHVWFAAHLYEVNVQRKFEQKIGKSMQKPETKVGMGLDLTRPGQQVKVLDYLHAFADLDMDDSPPLRRARMFWAGNPREAY